jgi:hypothetical protein
MVALIALVATPAEAGKRHHKHRAAGVKGVVLDDSCAGACPAKPASTPYSGPVTVIAKRASDGVQVASREPTDGHFRIRLKRGSYDISSVPSNGPTCEPQTQRLCPPPCEPQQGQVCPLSGNQPAAIIAPCLTGETQRVRVRGHRFTHVDLHVRNVCIA